MSEATPRAVIQKRIDSFELHDWMPDGFCRDCKTVHRTDFRQHDRCINRPKVKLTAREVRRLKL